MISRENWWDDVESSVRRMCRSIEDCYRACYKGASLHVPNLVETKFENEAKVLSAILDGVIGTTTWIVTQGGEMADEATEEAVVETIRDKFAQMRRQKKLKNDLKIN